jgi:hypothetical protein
MESSSHKPGITNRMPAGTLVPSEGFWGARENFRISVTNWKLLIFNCVIICHNLAMFPLEPVGVADARTQP